MRSLPGRVLAALPASIAALATAVALYSAWHSGGYMWRWLDSSYHTYASYSDLQRQHAPLDHIPLPSQVFDFYAANLERGDRIYFYVMPSGFSPDFDVPAIVALAGRFYLLPAVEAADLRTATVVVSFNRDPALLHVHFLTEARAGEQQIYVSRLRTP
jgi:hypothetical protein